VVLRVHPSNFAQTGFVEAPDAIELARLAHAHGAIVVDDLGSGAFLDTAAFGLAHEPTPAERLAAGADLWQVIPHLGERFDPAIEDAVARAELAISPGYFGGRWMIMDLPGLVLFGFRPDGSGESRRRMGGLAGRLKALADPTRLAILAHVARTPASITELTGVFGVTQPALSAHFKILRDAAFVTGTRVGGRTIYSIDGDRVEAALDECAGAIIPVPAAIRPERAPG